MPDSLIELRAAICRATRVDEALIVNTLIGASKMTAAQRALITEQGIELVENCRARSHEAGTLDVFLQEFGLANDEGIALMCLAEALLRVPDDATADRLIAEKIQSGDWSAHRGKSTSAFVNASVWGLMLTGKIVRLEPEIAEETAGWVRRLVSTLGEPVVRQAVLQAMRIMAGQYVLGRSIAEGLDRGVSGNPSGTRFSFDMLGEGARTDADARRYLKSYAEAIAAIVAADDSYSVIEANGISVKLSALHPRYEYRHTKRVMQELLPRVKELALAARLGGVGFSIDAEEADRLELSLDIFEALARDPQLGSWDGLGFVLQAYQKRAWYVTDWLIALAAETGHRFMVRLVKGAYWDGEIKHAQEQGLEDYPVFTRKCHSDVCYQLCAEKLFSAPTEIFPQFATHNAHTAAMVGILAQGREFEYQRLHGMGQLLYDQMSGAEATPVRVYAPIGSHRDLLPYLVRRLLENGANSSFVNRFLDAKVPAAELMQDPFSLTASQARRRHPGIPVPPDLYRQEALPWRNSRGMDLANPMTAAAMLEKVGAAAKRPWSAAPIVGGKCMPGESHNIVTPACSSEVIGQVCEADATSIEQALKLAVISQLEWDGGGVEIRCRGLEKTAALMEQHGEELIGLIVAEAGRTIIDALSELREAVDFCRYYAQRARADFAIKTLPGPTGEINELSLHGRGVFACISPWNFPLAIFTGQVVAALVAGNSVIAKPAEQTPLIAARAVSLMHEAGIPVDVLQLLPGDGPGVGGKLVDDERISGVVFTGSTATARLINRRLARRDGAIATLIAETGGLNVMLVDATALPEQVVDDVISSAFHSAGQRCSALRVLFLQEDIADTVIEMLRGAMAELSIGNPALLATDVGPVIDLDARQLLEQHGQRMGREAKLLATCVLGTEHSDGFFFAPALYEISTLSQLPEEVFGPILHLIRYATRDMNQIIEDINASAYGLTLGIHSRIHGFARDIFNRSRIGNTYINRNMVGAVVGVNPFGGQGLSGTGPKAGGPHYLQRFATEKTRSDNAVARGGNAQLFSLDDN